MAVQGFFSPEKTRMAGEKENNAAFSVKVKPVTLASNINKYNEQTPSLDYAPDRVGEYIRESEIKSYKEEEKTYKPKKESYFDQSVKKSPYGQPHTTGDQYDQAVNFFTSREPGTFQERKDDYVRKNLKYGTAPDGTPTATSTSVLNYGQPLNVSTEKLKSFLVKDAKEDQAAKEKQNYESLKRAMQQDEAADYQKKLKAEEDYKKAVLVDKYGFDPREYINPNVPPGTRINEETGLQEIPKYYQKPNPLTDPTDKNYLGDDVVPENFRANYVDKLNKTELGTMPSMGITEAGREEAKLNRLEKAKQEANVNVQENKNILQRVGDFVGDTFNRLTGTEAAGADTLQSQGINTNATVNIAQMGNVSPSVQKSRDAIARSNLRKSGLNRTVGGQSSQANYGRSRKGFGTGTHGKGMPSNPKGMRQQGVGVSANNLSRHSVGHSSTQPKGNQGNQGGNQGGDGGDGGDSTNQNQGLNQSLSRRRGRGGSKGGGGSSGGGGGNGGGPGGGSPGGGGMNRSKSRRRCDVRCKIDISPLINSNLVKDDLAKLAYFVQEIK